MTDITKERLLEIIAGCEGVVPGPWKYEGSIYEHMGAGLRSLPDDRGFAQLWVSGTVAIDAAHIARLDPATVKAMAELALQALNGVGVAEQASAHLMRLTAKAEAVMGYADLTIPEAQVAWSCWVEQKAETLRVCTAALQPNEVV